MPGKHPAELLRLEPSAIPAVRAALDEALAELSTGLLRLRQEAVILEPWLGDITSETVLAHYQRHVIDARIEGDTAGLAGRA